MCPLNEVVFLLITRSVHKRFTNVELFHNSVYSTEVLDDAQVANEL